MNRSKWIFITVVAIFGAYLLTEKDRSDKSLVSKVIFSGDQKKDRSPASIAKIKYIKSKKSPIKLSLNSSSLELKKIYNCYEKMNCPFPQTDSRSYDLAVGKKLKSKLEELYEKVEEEDYVDERVSTIAREYMKIADGHVKEVALMLLSTQPPSQENLDSILNDVINYHDSSLLNMAFLEFGKYDSVSDRQLIEESLFKNLQSGSILVREGITKNIYPMISSDNKERFVSLLQKLPSNSLMYRNLRNSLERFDEQNRI